MRTGRTKGKESCERGVEIDKHVRESYYRRAGRCSVSLPWQFAIRLAYLTDGR